MTDADEALLYARQDYAETFRRFKPHISEEILQGKWDDDAGVMLTAHGYRAGAAASAERIKELEAALAKANEPEWFFLNTGVPYPSLYEAVGQRVDPNGSQTQLVKVDTGRACKTIWAAVRILGPGGEWSLTPCATEAEARDLLKETDQ